MNSGYNIAVTGGVSNVVAFPDFTNSSFQDARFGGGKGGGGMETTVPMKDYIDARTDAVESRLGEKLNALSTKSTIWGAAAAVIGAVFTGVAIILSTLAFGSDRFNGGLSISPAVAAAQKAQAETDEKQDAQLSLMNDKLDILVRQTADK